jgi:hypothetical protein
LFAPRCSLRLLLGRLDLQPTKAYTRGEYRAPALVAQASARAAQRSPRGGSLGVVFDADTGVAALSGLRDE